jgi:hypothetical protein
MMKYDLFISYSSHDRSWARKLKQDLESRNVKCFFDQTRLVKGEKWENQLLPDLLASRHFLVLWSEKARGSDWVSEELYRFKGDIDPTGEGQPVPGRLIYSLSLQGQNATLSAYQGYLDLKIQAAYTRYLAEANALGAPPQDFPLLAEEQQVWDEWVGEIAAAARSNSPAVQVPVAVLALTTALFDASPPVTPEFDFVAETDMDTFLMRLGVEKMSQLRARYGATPFDWHPFGSSQTVKDLLEELRSDPATGINTKLAELKNAPVKWSFLDVITPPVNQLANVAQPLVSGPCLVIIDPVSLLSGRVWQRYVTLAPCFTNSQAAIAFLTPLGTNQPLLFLRQCITELGKPNLAWFYDPIPYNPTYANCGINIADWWEIRRLMLASLGRQPGTRQPSGGEGIVN